MAARIVVSLQHHVQLDAPAALARQIIERAGFVVLSEVSQSDALRLSVARRADQPELPVEEIQTTLLAAFQHYRTLAAIIDIQFAITPPPPPPPEPTAQRWQVTADFLNVRSMPISGDNIIGQLPRGAIVTQVGAPMEFWVPHDGGGQPNLRGWSSARYMTKI